MSKIYWSGRELIMEGVEVLFGTFRNFAGEKRKFNDAGKRNFNISIEPELIPELLKDNINVKYFKADLDDEDGDEKPGFVKINVNFGGRKDPEVFVRYGENGKFTELNESLLSKLDTAVFDNVDLIVNPYRSQDDEGRERVTLYLNKGYFTLHMDPLAAKYEQAMTNGEEPEELPFD